MKIDTDLRLAIKSAEKAQPNIGREEKAKNRRASIDGLIKSKPVIARDVKRLSAIILRATNARKEAEVALCNSYGLSAELSAGKIHINFANCDEGSGAFVKAGGQIIRTEENWSFDSVMRQLVIATPKEGAAILKKLGINWQ